jgi:hypothetical protein
MHKCSWIKSNITRKCVNRKGIAWDKPCSTPKGFEKPSFVAYGSSNAQPHPYHVPLSVGQKYYVSLRQVY